MRPILNLTAKQQLTAHGWITLLQLAEQPAHAGDLITKHGRDDLVKYGLCEYGPDDECWRLTRDGALIALQMGGSNWLSSAMH